MTKILVQGYFLKQEYYQIIKMSPMESSHNQLLYGFNLDQE
jgi:hypothetical protein